MTHNFSTKPCAEHLKRFIELIWSYRADPAHGYEQVLPGITSQLLINLHEDELRHWTQPGHLLRTTPGTGVQGILTAPVLIDARQKRNICGVAFTSYGLSAFCNIDASRFTDSIIDASNLWGASVLNLRSNLLANSDPATQCQVIEQFLLQCLNVQDREIVLVEDILSAMQSGVKIATIREQMGLSQRRLHALFDKHIGVRPKTFLRLGRLGSVLDSLTDTRALTDVAFDNGFADQAHLTREFRTLTGSAPSQHQSIKDESRHVQMKSDILFKTPRRR